MRISPIRNYGQAKKMSFGMYTNNEAKNLAKKILTAKPDDEDYIQYQYECDFKTIDECPFVYVSLNSPNSLKAEADMELLKENQLDGSIEDFKEPRICKTPQDLSWLAADIDLVVKSIKYKHNKNNDENIYVDESDIEAEKIARIENLAK